MNVESMLSDPASLKSVLTPPGQRQTDGRRYRQMETIATENGNLTVAIDEGEIVVDNGKL
jgi:hypothetical protein